MKAKFLIEKTAKSLEEQLIEMSMRIDDGARTINDVQSQKSRLQSENANLLSQVEEAELKIDTMVKSKHLLNIQLEETRNNVDEETRARSSLSQQLRNLRSDYESLKISFDEEIIGKGDLQRKLAIAQNEGKDWKQRYETCGLGQTEELEEAKKKLTVKLTEAEEQVAQALAKVCYFKSINYCYLVINNNFSQFNWFQT